MTTPGFASSKAIDRFRILQPHLEEDVPLARIAVERGVAERTLRRWLAAWRANGVHGLERAPRSDTGKRRRLDPDLEGLVRSMATRRPRPTAAAIHRKVQAEAKTRGVAGASYAVVASIVRGIGPERIAVATDAAAYRDRYELVHRSDAGASNEMWQGVFVCRALCPEHVDAPSLASIRGARRRTKERLKQSIADDEVRYEHDESPVSGKSAPRRPRFGGLKLYAADD